MRYNN